ncbi:MAG: cellulose biosynthesis protein BcsS [Sphingomonadales bacterium]
MRRLYLALVALLIAVPAHAEPYKGVLFAGGTVSESSGGYAGGMISLPGAALGRGLGVRVGTNGGEYKYDASGTRIAAEYVGGELALVYQISGGWGWANFSAGPRVSYLNLTPNDPGNKLQGTKVDAGIQSDGAYNIEKWHISWFGSYGIANESYLAKLQLGYLVAERSGTRIGVEGGIQGDSVYTKGNLGAFVSTSLMKDVEIQIAAGATEQAGRGARAYVTIGLSKLF